MGHEIENDEVIQPHRGDQGQVSGPQVPLPGHGDEIENPNWASRDYLHEIENDKIIHPLEGDQELGERGLGYVAP